MARKRKTLSRTQVAKEVPVTYKSRKVDLDKVSSNDQSISRMVLGAQGIDGLKTVNGSIQEHCHRELRWPNSIATYKSMSLDPTVAAVNNFYNMMIARAEFKFVAPKQEDGTVKPDVQDATDFLNWCMLNMDDQTWQQFISGIGTYRTFGFSLAEKLWTTVKTGKYKGKKKWKSLAHRSQETVERWEWSKSDPDKLTGVVQKAQCVDTERYGHTLRNPERKIDRGKLLLFRFDPKNNNPQGTSPLDGCWEAWKYLNLVREYQAVGVAKDMGGVPVIGYPVEKLIEAAADPSCPAAQTLEAIKANAARLHAGEESFVIVPVDYDDLGKPLYSFELKGITGGGKQYDTSEIIRQYQNEILTVYSASMLKLGQDSTGSFALSDNMNNLLAFGVQHNLDIITEQINTDLIPQTLAFNGWLFDQEDMPTLQYGDIAPRDLDELGKFIQRAVTSGAMTVGKALDNTLREAADLPEATYSNDDEIPEKFSTTKESGAGKGDGTSGTGGSQTNGDDNKENTG